MRKIALNLLFSALFAMPCIVRAGVPQIIQYESRIAVGTDPYNGIGHFKFAFVDPNKAITYWSNDGSSVNAWEPEKYVSLPVTGGLYSISLGDLSLTNMVPISPTVFTNSAVNIRVWFSNGQTPFQLVFPDQQFISVGYAMTAANVADGSVTAAQIANGAVISSKIASGAVGASQMAPNAAAQNLTASGGLVISDQDNALNLTAAGFQKIGKILADGDRWVTNVAYSPNPKAHHSAVWTGNEMIVWGGYDNYSHYDRTGALYDFRSDMWTSISAVNSPTSGALFSGYSVAIWTGQDVLVRGDGLNWKSYNKTKNTWSNIATSNAPPESSYATYTWTGTELIVICQGKGSRRYDPVNNQWKNLSITNGPTGHAAVWTGSELIVWGGIVSPLSYGGIYNPRTDTWKAITRKNAPSMRSNSQAVWTGNAMIVWGGQTTSNSYGDNTGGIYYPANDTWKPMSTLNAPTGRRQFTSCWTGKEFIVFGGVERPNNMTITPFIALNNGGKYDPITDTWTSIDSGPFEPFIGYSSIWTGVEFVFFGGGAFDSRMGSVNPIISQSNYRNSGVCYNPNTGNWRYLNCAPVGRIGHSAVWTGSEYIIFGGATNANDSLAGSALLRDGAKFNPKKGTWVPISTLNAPSRRKNHQAIWTGKEMIVWGGVGIPIGSEIANLVQSMADGGRYDPALDRWLPMSTNGAPTARSEFSMIWSGSEVIIFGGLGNKYAAATGYLNSGSRYDPEFDAWKSISMFKAPSPRSLHAAAWTGEEMIVWGGKGSSTATTAVTLQDSGARYNPISNTWTPISTTGAPRGSTGVPPTAIWTGEEMLLWGHGNPLGARYRLSIDSWEMMNLANLPVELFNSTINPVWTGEEMVLCSGKQSTSRPSKVGRYNPLTDQWTVTSISGGTQARTSLNATWANNEMILFGGFDNGRLTSNTLILQSATPVYLYGKP